MPESKLKFFIPAAVVVVAGSIAAYWIPSQKPNKLGDWALGIGKEEAGGRRKKFFNFEF
jgi:hypothetical protein